MKKNDPTHYSTTMGKLFIYIGTYMSTQSRVSIPLVQRI